MKLLVLAQTPPPVHGQSLMVKMLVEGLPASGITVHHVNLRLSQDGADIGRWRIGKIVGTLLAATHTIASGLRYRCDTLYYVPAPAKRGALYRDWLLMLVCRPFFCHLVLHWHAVGLGEWLSRRATAFERVMSRSLLGRASLALVLAPELAADAETLSPRRIAVVGNCSPDPGSAPPRERLARDRTMEVLFLGQCSRTKGVFAALEAVVLADRESPSGWRLTVAGTFVAPHEEEEFHARIATLPPGLVHYAGAVDSQRKSALFRTADVFCFPSQYPAEGQPLTLIEALAHDVPIITTRWRAIPGMLPRDHVWLVEDQDPVAICAALNSARRSRPPNGALRAHYLARYTPELHLSALARIFDSLSN